MSVSEIYNRMLQDPKNRKSSSGMIKQPTLYDELGMSDPDMPDFLTEEEKAYMAEMDKRMLARQQGHPVATEAPPTHATNVSESRIEKIETEIKDIKQLLTHMMKTHIKLIEQQER